MQKWKDIMTAILAFAAGFCFGCAFQCWLWQRMAIQHGAAHYDAVSGEFKWNDEKGDE